MKNSKGDVESNSKHQIKYGAVFSYISIAVEIIAGLLFTPWMVKTIGKSDYAIFTLANTFITTIMLDFGLGTAVVRFLSKYRSENDTEMAKNFLGIVSKVYLILDAIVAAVLIAFAFLYPYFYKGLTAEELDKFKVVFIIVAGYSLISFPFTSLNGIFTANEQFISFKIIAIVTKLISIGFMALALVLGFGLYGMVIGSAVSVLVTIVIKVIYLKSQKLLSINFHYKNKELMKQLFQFSLWLTLIVVAQRVTFNAVPSVLGVVSNSSEIAIYGFAATIETYSYSLASALNGMFMPKIARILKTETDSSRINALFFKVGKLQIMVIGLIFCGFVTFGKEFIALVMGSDYSMSYICGILLVFPKLMTIPKQIPSSTCYLTSNVKYESIITFVLSILACGFCFLLGYFYGALGASIVLCFFFTLLALVLDFWLYRKKMGFRIPSFYIRGYLPYLGLAGTLVAVFFLIKYFFPVKGLVLLCIYILAFALLYILVFWLFFFGKAERTSFFEWLGVFKKLPWKSQYLLIVCGKSKIKVKLKGKLVLPKSKYLKLVRCLQTNQISKMAFESPLFTDPAKIFFFEEGQKLQIKALSQKNQAMLFLESDRLWMTFGNRRVLITSK